MGLLAITRYHSNFERVTGKPKMEDTREKLNISKISIRLSYIYLISIFVILILSMFSLNQTMKELISLYFLIISIIIPLIIWKDIRKIIKIYFELIFHRK